MDECPLLMELNRIGWSPLSCSQVAGVAATRTADVIAGRVPRIPGAILKALEPYSDIEKLVADHASWFAGLAEPIRARAEELARLAAQYGESIDGGNDESGHNLSGLRDVAGGYRKAQGR